MIVILGACHPIGQAAAVAFADQGKRVIAVDADKAAVDALVAQNPGWIEGVVIDMTGSQMRDQLKDIWAEQPIELVINLMPVLRPYDISAQMRTLKIVLQTTLRGLVKGQGTLISVVGRAADPLAFVAHGMGAAMGEASVALARAIAGKGVRVRCMTVGPDTHARAFDTLRLLHSPAGRALSSVRIEVEEEEPAQSA